VHSSRRTAAQYVGTGTTCFLLVYCGRNRCRMPEKQS